MEDLADYWLQPWGVVQFAREPWDLNIITGPVMLCLMAKNTIENTQNRAIEKDRLLKGGIWPSHYASIN